MWRVTSWRSMSWLAVAVLSLAIAGCGGSGGGGGKASNELAGLLGYQAAEGSKSAPLSIGDAAATSIVLHQDGSVAPGGSTGIGDTADSYYTATVQPGVEYLVTMSNLNAAANATSADADLYVFNDDGTFTNRECANRPFMTGSATETCTFIASRDTIYIGVDGSKSDKGVAYNLSVIVKPVSEGTDTAPQTLANPNRPPIARPASTVGGGEISYYVVDVNPAPTYTTTYNSAKAASPTDPGPSSPTPSCSVGFQYYMYAYKNYTYDPATGIPLTYVITSVCYSTNYASYQVLDGSTTYTLVYDTAGCVNRWYYGYCYNQIPRKYLITVTDMTDDVDLYVSDDTNYFFSSTGKWVDSSGQITGCQSTAADVALELCQYPGMDPADYVTAGYPETIPLYIAVDRSFAPDGAAYTINVVEQPYAEGVPLHESYVAPDMGIAYTLPVTLCTVFQDTDYAQPCYKYNHYSYDPATYNYVYPTPGSSYPAVCPAPLNSVSYTPNQPQDNGYSGNNWWNRDCLGTVAAGGAEGMPKVLDVGIDSFYRVKVDPAKEYVLTLRKPSDAVNLYVYDKDNSFRTGLTECQPPWDDPAAQSCILNPTLDFVYFAVDGYPSTGGANFQLIVHEKYSAENNGSGVPKVLTAGTDFTVGVRTSSTTAVPYRGKVGAGGTLGINSAEDSYYRLATGLPGTQFRITMSNMIDDADLYVYGGDSSFGQDASLAGTPCIPQASGEGSEGCLMTSDANGDIYLAVDGYWTANGTAFDLTIEIPTSEGCITWYVYCGGYYGPVYIGSVYQGGSNLSYDGFVVGNSSPARTLAQESYIAPFTVDPLPDNNIGTNLSGGYFVGDSRVSYYYAYVTPYKDDGVTRQFYEVKLTSAVAGLRLNVFAYDYNNWLYMFDPNTPWPAGPPTTTPCREQSGGSGNTSVSCKVAGPDSWNLLIAVDGYQTTGGNFTLTVSPTTVAVTAEGSAASPVSVGSATVQDGYSYDGVWGQYSYAVYDNGSTGDLIAGSAGIGSGDDGDSYYKVTVTPGYTYYLGIYNYGSTSGPADIYVYQDAGSAAASFAGTAACKPDAAQTYNGYMWDSEWYYSTYYPSDYAAGYFPYYDKWCAVTATGSALYIGVDGSRISSITPTNTMAQYYIYAYWGWY